jgi:hypothetical protein
MTTLPPPPITIDSDSLEGFTVPELEVVSQAEALLAKVMDSDSFRDKVLAADFTETNGMTNQEIYDCLLEGNHYFCQPSGTIRLNLVMYMEPHSRVIGYTYLESITTYINRKFFATPVSIASNLIHEYSHILGFTHRGNWSTSIPYTLNRIFEACCAELGLSK